MASFFSRIFGGRGGGSADAKRSEPVHYEGCAIFAAPEPAGDQWRLVGFIVRESEDGTMERKFLRADTFGTHDEAVEFAVRKGKQIVDEQGARLFADGAESRNV